MTKEEKELAQKIVKIRMEDSDMGSCTIRQYLCNLLAKLLAEDDFNAKRPFGNSAWRFDVYRTLIQNDVIEGSLDEDGYVDHYSEVEAQAAMSLAICYMMRENQK